MVIVTAPEITDYQDLLRKSENSSYSLEQRQIYLEQASKLKKIIDSRMRDTVNNLVKNTMTENTTSSAVTAPITAKKEKTPTIKAQVADRLDNTVTWLKETSNGNIKVAVSLTLAALNRLRSEKSPESAEEITE